MGSTSAPCKFGRRALIRRPSLLRRVTTRVARTKARSLCTWMMVGFLLATRPTNSFVVRTTNLGLDVAFGSKRVRRGPARLALPPLAIGDGSEADQAGDQTDKREHNRDG